MRQKLLEEDEGLGGWSDLKQGDGQIWSSEGIKSSLVVRDGGRGSVEFTMTLQ